MSNVVLVEKGQNENQCSIQNDMSLKSKITIQQRLGKSKFIFVINSAIFSSFSLETVLGVLAIPLTASVLHPVLLTYLDRLAFKARKTKS
ncbi:hypothetical protein BpHYR1_034363 [Brachionus plicatilis]|uniref:Uncharacterized protein n=1 Tax=Brachionus plicatilis TaxID=10195 RepID=A0A3M7T3I2_BRAPC|nr:hypothetical protein BpHYR1_034363 [Brachionus plicatilis]